MPPLFSLEVEFKGGHKVVAALRHPPTPTVKQLATRLPFQSTAHRWGDEIYFEAPFHSDLEADARKEMEVGEVAFWPEGDAIAIFFGPTPVSDDHKPRAYSPCNIIGRIENDVSVLRVVREGDPLVVKRL